MREPLQHANKLRSHEESKKKVNKEIVAAVMDACEGELSARHQKSCQVAACKMEEILFSVGGPERIVATLRYFKDRATVGEVAHIQYLMVSNN